MDAVNSGHSSFDRDALGAATPGLAANDRAALRAAQRKSEADIVRGHLAALATGVPQPEAVKALGRAIIGAAKTSASKETLIDAFMNRYRLSTEEGVVLMCLAEALLRVPDESTANALIKDKITGRDWTESDARSGKWLVDMSAWGLQLGSATLLLDQMGSKADAPTIFKRLIRRSGEPVIRQSAYAAMKLLGKQFVMGETIEGAIRRAGKIAPAELCSFDMLGEAARTEEDAQRYFRAYQDAIRAIGQYARPGNPHDNHGISIKLSAIHPRYEYLQRDRMRDELYPRVAALVAQARAANVPIMIDAEESDRLEPHMDICEWIVADGLASDWPGFGIVIQAYMKRAPEAVEWLYALARRAGVKLAMRLVKGAYWDSEIKRSQVLGTDYFPVYTAKNNTDLSYMRCVRLLHGMTDAIYPCFATHNAMTIAWIMSLFGQADTFELQRLHGMGEGAHEALKDIMPPARPVRIYAPVGTHRDLLAYLVRRLLENGANSSFVHQFSDPAVTVEALAIDPREIATATIAGRPIPTGRQLYLPLRVNAQGYDINDPGVVEQLQAAMDKTRRCDWLVTPLIGGKPVMDGARADIVNPATGARIGDYISASPADIDRAIAIARGAQPDWSLAGGAFRAERLERAADLIEARMPLFLALAQDEAGKTMLDAIAEVREAIDFLRYYASEARKHFAKPDALPGPTGERNEMLLEGKGIFACISPWNFPLAIFLGQVSAALVAGNAVLCKPAEQTPVIAFEAVKLLHEAGVPPEVLAFVPGSGSVVGAAMSSHDRVAGVCFTGSTEVAQIINRGLAARSGAIGTLIAETGGLNAMIVDSTALPEQVARDVVSSSFQSAGQRCSALRLLVVQEDVADTMIGMVKGAMEELRLGDPADLTTDVGPVIDEEARAGIQEYIEQRRNEGRILAEGQRGTAPEGGTFVKPTIIRLDRIEQMQREIFGPVLHVVTFRAGELDQTIDAINASGYGLTLGIHTRIDAVAAHIAARARVGNIYINRNQIGAIVGCQPFGGCGLSGTGPKAGGPHYLFRFADEKTLSTDITASGGNTALMTSAGA